MMSLLKQFGFLSSRNFFAFFLVGLLSLGAVVGWARAEMEQSRDQLNRLSENIRQAGRDARYQADQVVYEYLGEKIHATRYRIQHAFPLVKKEIISGPEGARVIMLEDGTSLWSYFPDKGIVVKEASEPSEHILPVALPENLDLLSKNYRIYMRGPVTVDDGLTCQVVEFLPRKGDRPSREMWLEEKRKLPIRMYMNSPDGRPAYRTELKRIRWNPAFDADTFQIKVPKDTKVFEIQKKGKLSLEEARRLLNRRVMLPLFVPEGYMPNDIVLRVEDLKKRLQVIYSDGLSSYSVFQEWSEPDSPKAAAPAPQAEAVPHSYRYGLITVVTYDHGGKRTVAVGDINGELLLNVVRSVKPKE
jgi:outer membrane lipoprotein-sorting protein